MVLFTASTVADLDIFRSLGTPQSKRFHFGLTITKNLPNFKILNDYRHLFVKFLSKLRRKTDRHY
jgi:hypothetical protein